MKILKAVLLISAFFAVVLRLFTYENGTFMDESTAKLLNIIGIAAAGICIVSALILVYILKKEEKAEKEKTDEK